MTAAAATERLCISVPLLQLAYAKPQFVMDLLLKTKRMSSKHILSVVPHDGARRNRRRCLRCQIFLPLITCSRQAHNSANSRPVSAVTGPVFATRDAANSTPPTSAANSPASSAPAGIPCRWSPRELRHTFVSLMSDSGVPVEDRPPRRPHQLADHRDRLPPPAPPRHGQSAQGGCVKEAGKEPGLGSTPDVYRRALEKSLQTRAATPPPSISRR